MVWQYGDDWVINSAYSLYFGEEVEFWITKQTDTVGILAKIHKHLMAIGVERYNHKDFFLSIDIEIMESS